MIIKRVPSPDGSLVVHLYYRDCTPASYTAAINNYYVPPALFSRRPELPRRLAPSRHRGLTPGAHPSP